MTEKSYEHSYSGRFISEDLIGVRKEDGCVWEKTIVFDTQSGTKTTCNFHFNGQHIENDDLYEKKRLASKGYGPNRNRLYEAYYEKGKNGRMINGTFQWLEKDEGEKSQKSTIIIK